MKGNTYESFTVRAKKDINIECVEREVLVDVRLEDGGDSEGLSCGCNRDEKTRLDGREQHHAAAPREGYPMLVARWPLQRRADTRHFIKQDHGIEGSTKDLGQGPTSFCAVIFNEQ
jgi:hypothetical protein